MNNLDDVLSQPTLQRLKTAYAEKKTGRGIVFFVGSGLSRPAGLPDWKSLAEILTEECRKLVEINKISQANLGPLYAKMIAESNLWRKFSLIKEILGDTSFPASVKMLLSTDGKPIPRAYELMCRMDISGFVSLNIDNFLSGSIRSSLHDPAHPVYGKDGRERLQELTRSKPFLYQPHGSITSEKSWVFTEEDFEELCLSPLHDEFLSSVFLRDTVIFIGITADDVGASLRLAKLNEKGLRPQSHFWITTTAHIEKRDWAEENGIQQILYPSALGHELCLSAIFEAVKSHISVDVPITAPVTGFLGSDRITGKISPADLFKLDDIDEIRLTLNSIIKEHTVSGEISYDKYSSICKEYARAIHSCYMMPSGVGGEKWFGYKITGQALGGKTMGRIVPALDSSGHPVAVKILDQRRYSDELYLSAFRRGIKALKILAERGVDGTVNVRDAYELPPTIVMDYINCASLEDAVSSANFSARDCLHVIRSASETVLKAHLLPEIVLHRDIRPSNILLEAFDWGDGTFKGVKVIDFDLAWHVGALGEDFIRSDRDSLGFQAPEQIKGGNSAQRRTTLIDSFGLGATLYFCITRTNPELGFEKDLHWEKKVLDHTTRRFRDNPELSIFLSAIVVDSMRENVATRISVSEMHDRLEDAMNWLSGDTGSCSMDFLAEMVCSLSTPSNYQVDSRRKLFTFNTSSGLTVTFAHDFLDAAFDINFNYLKPGNVDNGRADKILNQLKSSFPEFFQKADPSRTSFAFTGSREFAARVTLNQALVKKDPWVAAECVKAFCRKLNIQ
ncbi:protein kinase domain-containing protein [Rhodobacter capsulatus]|uniref:protein kinase domain-containing protein n=1 Tax=Rhodobacter capsulatus TaxID=1061 RepID=UPI00402783C6